jgi:antitoxin (DNA-binding transcriptional repressor) of toxin-antitoxin stability system
MIRISVNDMQNDPLAYVHRAEAGETLVIVDHGKAVAELRPVAVPRREPRPFGLCAGEFVVPDDFNEPLPSDILDSFEGK